MTAATAKKVINIDHSLYIIFSWVTIIAIISTSIYYIVNDLLILFPSVDYATIQPLHNTYTALSNSNVVLWLIMNLFLMHSTSSGVYRCNLYNYNESSQTADSLIMHT